MGTKKWILFILLCCIEFSYSQVDSDSIPLVDLITNIEKKFDVKFSYAPSQLQQVHIKAPDPTLDLKQTLAYLNDRTLLNFSKLNQRYITISEIAKVITVCSKVVSSQTKQPLYGASVFIHDTKKGTITDVSGEFELIDVPLSAQITISYLGYRSKQVSVRSLFTADHTCSTLVLQEIKETLNEVVITKFLTTGIQRMKDGSTVLNTERFGILPGLSDPDILQSIQALPGVESVNESIANINVRGGTNDQNLMLWDHVKMYHSGHFFGLISAYNPYLTNKVVVIKNGTSSEYSDGVSSTINMLTKDQLTGKLHGGAGVNLINGDAFLEIPITKKLALHLSGRRSFTDFFASPAFDNYFKRSFQDSDLSEGEKSIAQSSQSSDFFFYDYSAKLLFDLNDNHKFRANIIGINNNLDYNESYTDNKGQTTSKTSNLSQENVGIGMNWRANWSESFKTELIGFYSNYMVDATDYSIETDQKLTQANEVLETGIKFKAYSALSENLSWLNGYQFSEIGILNQTTVTAPEYNKTKKDVLLNHALFSELEYNKGRTYFRIGVRANYFQKFNKVIIEPRLNIRQKLSRAVALKLQGEFKNQSATQIFDFQDDFLGVENRRWILANEQDIPISKSKQTSFGFEFNHNNLVFDVEGFYKRVEGITASNQGFYNNFQSRNATGSYDARGVEFLINKTADKYSTWLSYTYSVNDYEFKSFVPSKFPNNVDIRHSVTAAFNYEVLERLQLSLGGMWRTGKPYTQPVAGNETVQSGGQTTVNYDTPNSSNLDDYMRLDASLNYSLMLSEDIKGSIRVGVLNVLDRENSINRYYEVDPNNSEATVEVDNKALGLTPNISLRVKF